MYNRKMFDLENEGQSDVAQHSSIVNMGFHDKY